MKITILGAGTWGCAISHLLCENGHNVTVWSAISSELDELSKTRRHPNLESLVLQESIIFQKELEKACCDCELLIFAVPSLYIRNVAKSVKNYINKNCIIVSIAKGIETETLMSMTDVIAFELGENTDDSKIVALSGPTHAEEVAIKLPTTIVAASKSLETAQLVQSVFSNQYFRVYTNDDIIGVELCGAVKNVLALAAGISAGLGFGDNAKAAIITRGMVEIVRLGTAIGCNSHTFYGLAGIGDLIVTATSKHSRNNKCGYLIGTGMNVDDAVKSVGMVVEGINALPAVVRLSKKYNVEMPIVEAVDEIVRGASTPQQKVAELMTRIYKNEVSVVIQ